MWRSKLHEEKQWHVKKNKLEVKLKSMLCNVFTATCGVICSDCNIVDGMHFVRNLISGYLAGSLGSL